MQRQANLKSIIKCIHSCLFEVLFALIHLKNAALSKYVQTCKTWIPWNLGSRQQVWMDNVPSDVLIEDLIAWLAWPAHNRAYLIPRPFIRHRLHWSLYNYIMYLGQESSILYFIYWVQLLIRKRHWKHCSLLCPFKDLKSSNLVLLGNFWLSVGSKMLPVPATHL